VGGVVLALGILAGMAAAAAAYLRRPSRPPRSSEAQAELDRAVAAVDRELAADLELMTMFDQTKQAFVLENGQFQRYRDVIEREVPAAFADLASLYERVPRTEEAMERRGPAGSIRDEDRELVHEWEGDAREAQRALRAAALAPVPTRWQRVRARLGASLRRRST
jgi:hypothetical protein